MVKVLKVIVFRKVISFRKLPEIISGGLLFNNQAEYNEKF